MRHNNNNPKFNGKELPRNSFVGNPEPSSSGLSDIPYFERQESDDFMALQDARRVIDVLHHRVRSLENINIDLEYRLEQQAKQTMQAEYECTELDRSWKIKFAEMKKEADDWKKKHDTQALKTENLRAHLSRTERELYGILQRKYQLMRGGVPNGGNGEPSKSKSGAGLGDSGGSSAVQSAPTTPQSSQRNSTPLSSAPSNAPPEELCEMYRKMNPEQRQRRYLVDVGDFFGVS